MTSADLVTTRLSLHAVAEQLMAGPQYRVSGTIRLRARDDGFGTTTEPDVRVDGDELVVAGARIPLDGKTIAALGSEAGIDPVRPDLYADTADLGPDDELHVDVAMAAKLGEVFVIGDSALRAFAPGSEPVLWPEHFDIAIRVDDTNYGISPGDGFIDEPYAYVGVDPVPSADFWNAPFGAARRLAELAGADGVVAFFTEARTAR